VLVGSFNSTNHNFSTVTGAQTGSLALCKVSQGWRVAQIHIQQFFEGCFLCYFLFSNIVDLSLYGKKSFPGQFFPVCFAF